MPHTCSVAYTALKLGSSETEANGAGPVASTLFKRGYASINPRRIA